LTPIQFLQLLHLVLETASPKDAAMSQPVIRLSSTHKRLIYLVFALLWMSGALWLLSHYFFAIEGDFGPTPHPLEKWALRLHGFTAMLALIAVGSLATHHMRLAWSRKQNHRSGMAMFTLNAWLAATGYALYYFATDDNAAWLPLLHWVVGLALPPALVAHVVVGRRRTSHGRLQPKKQPRVAGRPGSTSASRIGPKSNL
ncbi:MAG TPA: hypothetical protein PKI23_10920, partial [Pseudomonadales bacterium]|nr:hypothetical protein [Pseudomonadales bacterium]HNN37489.1 hypothetical protein [Pseudomonadales bacterium]